MARSFPSSRIVDAMRKGQLLISATALTLAALASTSCAQVTTKTVDTKVVGKADDEKPVVVIDTTAGAITVELERAKTPITVENFLKYVDMGYYDGLVFHRVIPGFMIQGGGMTVDASNSLREKKPPLPPIKNESKTGLNNIRGTIAMARTRNPNSATSQFFINHDDNTDSLNAGDGYTAFGKVIDGMDVVDAIAKTPTDRSEKPGGVPLKAIVIKSIKRKAKS
jgi:peptidyl-prolyl cis-trans isomerase A (cyclophilin A)